MVTDIGRKPNCPASHGAHKGTRRHCHRRSDFSGRRCCRYTNAGTADGTSCSPEQHEVTKRAIVGRHGTQPKRVAEVDRVAAREAVEVEAAGEAEGIFLRETPDRTCVVRPDRRR